MIHTRTMLGIVAAALLLAACGAEESAGAIRADELNQRVLAWLDDIDERGVPRYGGERIAYEHAFRHWSVAYPAEQQLWPTEYDMAALDRAEAILEKWNR